MKYILLTMTSLFLVGCSDGNPVPFSSSMDAQVASNPSGSNPTMVNPTPITTCTQSCSVTNGVGIQSCTDDNTTAAQTCVLTQCNPGYTVVNGACVTTQASTEFQCTSYEALILNSVSDQLTTSTGANVPAQDPSGSGTCYYYPIVNLPAAITGSSSLTGTDIAHHDQDVVSRDHDENSSDSSDVWHPYIMNQTTLNMTFDGARTLQLTGGKMQSGMFVMNDISIDNFFLVGVYPQGLPVTTNNVLSFYSAWGTADSTVALSSGGPDSLGIAFNPAGINLSTDKTTQYSNGKTTPYSDKGVTTSSDYSLVPLNVEASGGTAEVPAVALTSYIRPSVPTVVDFRALDCGSARYLGNIYLLIK